MVKENPIKNTSPEKGKENKDIKKIKTLQDVIDFFGEKHITLDMLSQLSSEQRRELKKEITSKREKQTTGINRLKNISLPSLRQKIEEIEEIEDKKDIKQMQDSINNNDVINQKVDGGNDSNLFKDVPHPSDSGFNTHDASLDDTVIDASSVDDNQNISIDSTPAPTIHNQSINNTFANNVPHVSDNNTPDNTDYIAEKMEVIEKETFGYKFKSLLKRNKHARKLLEKKEIFSDKAREYYDTFTQTKAAEAMRWTRDSKLGKATSYVYRGLTQSDNKWVKLSKRIALSGVIGAVTGGGSIAITAIAGFSGIGAGALHKKLTKKKLEANVDGIKDAYKEQTENKDTDYNKNLGEFARDRKLIRRLKKEREEGKISTSDEGLLKAIEDIRRERVLEIKKSIGAIREKRDAARKKLIDANERNSLIVAGATSIVLGAGLRWSPTLLQKMDVDVSDRFGIWSNKEIEGMLHEPVQEKFHEVRKNINDFIHSPEDNSVIPVEQKIVEDVDSIDVNQEELLNKNKEELKKMFYNENRQAEVVSEAIKKNEVKIDSFKSQIDSVEVQENEIVKHDIAKTTKEFDSIKNQTLTDSAKVKEIEIAKTVDSLNAEIDSIKVQENELLKNEVEKTTKKIDSLKSKIDDIKTNVDSTKVKEIEIGKTVKEVDSLNAEIDSIKVQENELLKNEVEKTTKRIDSIKAAKNDIKTHIDSTKIDDVEIKKVNQEVDRVTKKIESLKAEENKIINDDITAKENDSISKTTIEKNNDTTPIKPKTAEDVDPKIDKKEIATPIAKTPEVIGNPRIENVTSEGFINKNKGYSFAIRDILNKNSELREHFGIQGDKLTLSEIKEVTKKLGYINEDGSDIRVFYGKGAAIDIELKDGKAILHEFKGGHMEDGHYVGGEHVESHVEGTKYEGADHESLKRVGKDKYYEYEKKLHSGNENHISAENNHGQEHNNGGEHTQHGSENVHSQNEQIHGNNNEGVQGGNHEHTSDTIIENNGNYHTKSPFIKGDPREVGVEIDAGSHEYMVGLDHGVTAHVQYNEAETNIKSVIFTRFDGQNYHMMIDSNGDGLIDRYVEKNSDLSFEVLRNMSIDDIKNNPSITQIRGYNKETYTRFIDIQHANGEELALDINGKYIHESQSFEDVQKVKDEILEKMKMERFDIDDLDHDIHEDTANGIESDEFINDIEKRGPFQVQDGHVLLSENEQEIFNQKARFSEQTKNLISSAGNHYENVFSAGTDFDENGGIIKGMRIIKFESGDYAMIVDGKASAGEFAEKFARSNSKVALDMISEGFGLDDSLAEDATYQLKDGTIMNRRFVPVTEDQVNYFKNLNKHNY